MPTIRESVECEIEFEMFCALCGNGICHNTKYRKNSTIQFETYCDACEKTHEQEISLKDKEIRTLEYRIAYLENDIKDQAKYIEKLENEE